MIMLLRANQWIVATTCQKRLGNYDASTFALIDTAITMLVILHFSYLLHYLIDLNLT